MAAKKSPGIDPLGHPPFSNVKLEGPKRKHDFHGSDASMTAMGSEQAVPGKHWEMQYDLCPYAKNTTPMAAFLPKRSKDRPQPHSKVNETDH